MAKALTVEVNPKMTRTVDDDSTVVGNTLFIFTPPIGEDYWLARVKLGGEQAVICFPKFGTIGCGFAKEEKDWNTNLPLACPSQLIFEHIKCNKGRGNNTDAECVAAIELLQKYALDAGLITQEDFEKMKDSKPFLP